MKVNFHDLSEAGRAIFGTNFNPSTVIRASREINVLAETLTTPVQMETLVQNELCNWLRKQGVKFEKVISPNTMIRTKHYNFVIECKNNIMCNIRCEPIIFVAP